MQYFVDYFFVYGVEVFFFRMNDDDEAHALFSFFGAKFVAQILSLYSVISFLAQQFAFWLWLEVVIIIILFPGGALDCWLHVSSDGVSGANDFSFGMIGMAEALFS